MNSLVRPDSRLQVAIVLRVTTFDMNLLRPLQALLEERNVSRAAVRIQLSQPATSAALRRLRSYYNDELLVRVGRTMELTPFARALLPSVTNGLAEIRPIIEAKSMFTPSTSDRRFVLAATDYMTALIAGPLLSVFRTQAPNAAIDFVPLEASNEGLNRYERIDAVLGPDEYAIPGSREHLFTDGFVVLGDHTNLIFHTPEPAVRLLESVPHAVAYLTNPDYPAAEELLAHLGINRRISARLFGLASLPLLVSNTDMVALVPRLLAIGATHIGSLRYAEFPPEVEPKLRESIHWHPRNDTDPALLWLRSALKQAVPLLFDSLKPLHQSARLWMD